jgi:hypothetical protein
MRSVLLQSMVEAAFLPGALFLLRWSAPTERLPVDADR